MKVKLPSGKLAQIGVRYTDDEVITNRKANENPIITCRGARVRLTIDGLLDEEARSVCKPPDGFCRHSARKYALTRLLQKVGKKLTQQDCQTILKLVCPTQPSYSKLKKENFKLKQQVAELSKILDTTTPYINDVVQ